MREFILLLRTGVYALCLATVLRAAPPIEEAQQSDTLQNSMIWVKSAPPGEQAYVAFRKTFELDSIPAIANLRIFADTRYILWLNGEYIERGPCRFDPKRPEYDILSVVSFLRKSKNAMAILVHNYGKEALESARIMEHEPGLTAKLDLSFSDGKTEFIKTDETWRVNSKTRFLPSPGSYASIPDNIDARLDEEDWTQLDFDDSSWENAIAVDGKKWGNVHSRAIPLLSEKEITPLTIVLETKGEERNESLQSLAGRLPLVMHQGHRVVLDVGREVQAYSVLDFEADEGSELVVGYSVRFYDSGRKPERVDREHTNHYIARGGRQQYMSTDTFGCKYLILTIKSGVVKFYTIKAVECRYPFARLGNFESSNEQFNDIWNICVNTVEICSEDAYVDTAERERAEWMADGYMMGYRVSRITLAGPGTNGGVFFSDYRLLRNMLRHVALSQLPDGRLQPMRPSNYPVEKTHGVIDDYSCLWVQAVRELYDRSGDKDFIEEVWPVVVKAMDYFLNRRSLRGLVNAMEFVYFNNPLVYKVCEGATVNAYIYRSLLDTAYLGRLVEDNANAGRFEEAARNLYENYNQHLWNEQAGSYDGSVSDKEKTSPTSHAATLALFYEMVPPNRYQKVLKFMLDHFEKENPFPYTYVFYLDVLFRQNTELMDRFALETILKKWTSMTSYETKTTCENWGDGSFVHESGASPAYFLSAYVLGVRTQSENGALRLVIEPRLGDLKFARGAVLTEYGRIPVSWNRENKGQLKFSFEIPENTQAYVLIPVSSENPTLVVNGKTVVHGGKMISPTIRRNKRFLQFIAPAGSYEGSLN